MVDSENTRHARPDGSCPVPLLVCMIDDLGTGGAQRMLSTKIRQLDSQQQRIVVVSLGERADEVARLEAAGIEVHCLPAKRIVSPGRFVRVLQLLRRLRPDLVHTHLLTAHIVGGLCARLMGIPLVSTLHSQDPQPLFIGTWKRRAETLALRILPERVLAVGPSVAASNARRLGSRPIDVLPNPLSLSSADTRTDEVRRERYRAQLAERVNAGPGTRHLITVGRLVEEKGWPGLLECLDRLRSTHEDFRLVSVGDGPAEAGIQREIEKRDLQRHVYLLGRSDDVLPLLLGSDLFVMNSSTEGLPMALLEAMATGLPVIAPRVGDIEFVVGDQGGHLFDAGSIDQLLAALRHCLDRWPETRSLGEAGKARVLANFDADHWTRDLMQVYREVA